MSNNTLDLHEDKEIGQITWPFVRYTALIPRKLGDDIFVWLYLSLIVATNNESSLNKNAYSEETKTIISKLILDNFSTVIDYNTLEKVILYVENNYITKVKNPSGNSDYIIKPETFSFIETYENLFSENLEMKYIFTDGITGEVLPYFGDTTFLEDRSNKDALTLINNSMPSDKAVKRAYEIYEKLKRYSTNILDSEIQYLDDPIDDEREVLFDEDEADNQIDDNLNVPKKELKNLNDYSIDYIDNKKVIVNLQVKIKIKDNSLYMISPFDKNTNNWLTNCAKKGRSISEELDGKLKDLEKKYVISNDYINKYLDTVKSDFADKLKYCSKLYRLIDTLNDNSMRMEVLEIDQALRSKKDILYFYIGTILDNFIKKINYNCSSNDERNNTSIFTFGTLIDQKFYNKNINYSFIKSKNIYTNWQKKFNRNKPFNSFKSDFVDILLKTNLVNSINMYPSFIDDIFNLYNKRNAVDHGEHVLVQKDDIETLTKALSVLIELI